MSNESNKLEVLEQVESTEATLDTPYVTLDTLKDKLAEGIDIKDILEIKPYISITRKQILIDSIIESSTQYAENGLAKINYCNLELFKDIYTLSHYTNLLIDGDNVVDQYDYLSQNDILNLIYEYLNENELYIIDTILSKQIDMDLKVSNGIEGIVSKNMNMLQDAVYDVVSKIPDIDESKIESWVNLIIETIKNFDPKKMKILKKMMNFAKG